MTRRATSEHTFWTARGCREFTRLMLSMGWEIEAAGMQRTGWLRRYRLVLRAPRAEARIRGQALAVRQIAEPGTPFEIVPIVTRPEIPAVLR